MGWTKRADATMRREAHFGDRVVRCFSDRAADTYTVFERTVARCPTKEAVVAGEVRLTYSELADIVERTAAGLRQLGVEKDDRIGVLLGNRAEYIVAVLAALRVGAIAVPIGTRLVADEVRYVLEHCGAALLICDREFDATVGALGSLPGLHCAEVTVVDEHGREQPSGDVGEIWIKGPMVVPGYWADPQATAEAFTGGFWHSGDIGFFDADGYVHLVDRKKDMINRGGYKVYSVEVENVLAQHPGVLEAAVVAKPCDVLGERVHAFVSRKLSGLAERDLSVFCADRLADYKRPESFTLVDEPLPRNSAGKLLKRSLRERLTDRAG